MCRQLTARDLFDTKLMGVLTPRPSIVRANFEERYENEGPQAATDWFYKFSQDTDYYPPLPHQAGPEVGDQDRLR